MARHTPKLVTIFGATGNQGGSVARSLLENKDFAVRAITRNPESEASKALEALGATVVKANGLNRDSMVDAFRGSWAAFINTNTDDPIYNDPNYPSEVELGYRVIDGAAEAGVEHLVYSSMPSCLEMTDGKVYSRAWETKHRIEMHARSLRNFKTVNFLCSGWYLENFVSPEIVLLFGGFPHKPDADGLLTFKVPEWCEGEGKNCVPWIAIAEDFGDLVHGILLDPEKYHARGKPVHAVSEVSGYDTLLRNFEKVTGKKTRFIGVPNWRDFVHGGNPVLENGIDVFEISQTTGGRYMGREPTESKTAAELKRAAGLARGRQGRQLELTGTEQFWRSHFGDAAKAQA